MNNLKPLVWEEGESIVNSFPDPILVSINELAEFAILNYNGDPGHECVNFKLEITYGGGHWDCFCYDTIEKCQERANAWWKEKIEECFIFKVPTIRMEQCVACNGLGQIARLNKRDTVFKYNFETCKTCSGEGKVNCESSETTAQ